MKDKQHATYLSDITEETIRNFRENLQKQWKHVKKTAGYKKVVSELKEATKTASSKKLLLDEYRKSAIVLFRHTSIAMFPEDIAENLLRQYAMIFMAADEIENTKL